MSCGILVMKYVIRCFNHKNALTNLFVRAGAVNQIFVKFDLSVEDCILYINNI